MIHRQWLLLAAFTIASCLSSITQDSANCPDVSCDLYCENDYEEDENGCIICRCRECAPIVCRMYCHYGYEKDTKGCDICQCTDRPTTTAPECSKRTCDYACDNGYQIDINGCKTCLCKDCPPLLCTMHCKDGFIRDDNGCEICKCKDVTNCPISDSSRCNLTCSNGLEKSSNGCHICKCKEQLCPPSICQLQCPNGFEKDINGCEKCKCLTPDLSLICDLDCPHGAHAKQDGCGWTCKETVCEGLVCNQGQICTPMKRSNCEKAGNCSWEAVCAPASVVDRCSTKMDPGICGTSLQRWHHDSSTQSCHKFTYNGCAGNLNNFNSKSECELACVEMSHPQLMKVSFIMFYFGSDSEVHLPFESFSLHQNLSEWMEIPPQEITNIQITQRGKRQDDSRPVMEVSFDFRDEMKHSVKPAMMFLGDKIRNRLIQVPVGQSSYWVADYNSFQLGFEPKTSHNSIIFIVCLLAGALFILSLAVAVIVCSRRKKEFRLHEET